MVTRYFRIVTGYDRKTDFITIEEKDLEKAYLCFLTESKSIIAGRPVRGKDIIDILPDYNKSMGLNPEYNFGGSYGDYEQAHKQGIMDLYHGVLEEIEMRVKYLLETNQTHLAGTGFELPVDKQSNPKLEGMKKQLSNNLKNNVNHKNNRN